MPLRFEDIEFHSPWLLALALPALAAVWWGFRRRRPAPGLVFPSVRRFSGMRPSWRQRARFLVPALHSLAALLLGPGLVAGARRLGRRRA